MIQLPSSKKLCPYGGKVGYASENRAKNSLRTLARKGSMTNDVTIYKCPNCYMYHFTSKGKR